MILSAPRSQGPPQPPLLPPPARKIIPKPPPPPSCRPLLAPDCSSDALSPPQISASTATAVLRNRASGSCLSMLRVGTSFAGGGLIPIPPPSVPFKASSNPPPPPPPENPAQVNPKQSQHIHPQPPLVIPLEPARFSTAARSPTHREPIRNTGTVLVLPPPCCPQQSTIRPDFQKSRPPAHNQRPLCGEEASLPCSQFSECGYPHICSRTRGGNAFSPNCLQEENKSNFQCNNAEGADSGQCHTAGAEKAESELKQGFRPGWGLKHTVEGSLRVKLIPPTRTGNSLTSHRLRRTDPSSLHFLHREETSGPHPSSPEWKGRRFRASTHLVRHKATKEKSCKLAIQQSLSQFLPHVPLQCTTQTHVLAASHQRKHRKPLSSSTISAPGSQHAGPSRIPPPPASSPDESVDGTGKQKFPAPARTTSTACASPVGKLTENEEQSLLASRIVHCGESPHGRRAAHARSSPLEAETNSRCSEHLSSNRWWNGVPTVKPCYSVASSSSSGSSSSSTQGDCEAGAGEWNTTLPFWHGTAEPHSDTDELPWIRRDLTTEKKSSFFLARHSFSDDPGETQHSAEDCSHEALERLHVDHRGAQSCSVQSSEGHADHAQGQGIDVVHCIQREVDPVSPTHGLDSVGEPPDDSTTKPSTFRSSTSSFALTASTRSGFTRITVLSPPTEAAEADKRRVPDWASVSQLRMGGDPLCGRAGETTVFMKAKGCSWELQSHTPWSVSDLHGTAARRAMPQKLRSPEPCFEAPSRKSTLSHLPPSPLTPLILTDNTAERVLLSLLLAGEQQRNRHTMLEQGEHVPSDWNYNRKTENNLRKAGFDALYCEQAKTQSPRPPSQRQSPRYAGSAAARCRRRKQNKVRRRLKEKLRREEPRERRQLRAPAVAPDVSDEERKPVKDIGNFCAPAVVERTGSPHTAEHIEKPTFGSSRTTTDCDLDSYMTGDAQSIPDCEAWASSPAVVARHIKSRRLLRVDNERRTEILHNAQLQQDSCRSRLLESDNASRVNTANADAFSDPCAQEHHMQAKCNSLFMPSSCSSWPAYEYDRASPQGAVLYTFELMDQQQHTSRPHMSGRAKQSQRLIKAQQQEQPLQKEEVQMHGAGASAGAEVSQQAPAPLLTLRSSLDLLSRECSTSQRLSSPVCVSHRWGRLAPRTTVSGVGEGTAQLPCDIQTQEDERCTRERTSPCSLRSRVSSGAAESYCRNPCEFLESCQMHTSIESHTLHQDHTTCTQDLETRAVPSTLLSKSAEVQESAVLCGQRQCSLGGLTHAGGNLGRFIKEEVSLTEQRPGTAQHASAYQSVNSSSLSFHTVNDRGANRFDSSSTASCRPISRRIRSFNFTSTYKNDHRHILVCPSEDARVYHGGNLKLFEGAMPQSDCDENQRLPAGWDDTFCLGEVTLKTNASSCLQAGLAHSHP